MTDRGATRIEVQLEEADLVAAYRLMGRRNTRQARPAIGRVRSSIYPP